MSLPNFIINGVCKKGEEVTCNLGYACDACPYNKEKEIDKKYECFCCKKELKETDGSWISATPSGKCQDKTNAEKRFVCKGCNHA